MSDLHGVDVASYQGPPGEWGEPAGNIAWAAVKFTELQPGQDEASAYRNPEAVADWQHLKAHGKGRVAYLFGHPSMDAALTVKVFADAVTAAGLEDGDMVALDWEEADGLSAAQCSAWARDVCAGLRQELARLPLVYTYLDFAAGGHCDGLGGYPLWISDPSSPAGRPRVPRPWKTWTIHQYDITAPIDRDLAAYRHLAGMRLALGRRPAAAPAAPRAAAPKKKAVRKTAKTVAKTVKAEPVLTAGTANAALAAVIAYVLTHAGVHLTATQSAALITISAGLTSALAAIFTRPLAVSSLTAALSTAATAAGAFGLHIPVGGLGAEMPAASLLVGLLLRGHVSPAAAQPGAPATAAEALAPSGAPST